MAPRKRKSPDLLPHREHLARLIDTAIAHGHHAPEQDKPYEPWVWTNEAFGLALGTDEGTVRGWRGKMGVHTPPNIVPILRVLYGDPPEFQADRDAMKLAWYRAKGIPPPEPPPPAQRDVQGLRPFADAAEIIDLAMSQPPPPTNGSTLTVPFTFRVHPDRDCTIEAAIAIGVEHVLVVVESEHWQPQPNSVFRGAGHPNAGDTAVPGAALFNGPRKQGERWIDGKPLGDQPLLIMERKQDGDGPVVMSARVRREDFVVVPRPQPGDNRPPEAIGETTKVVLNAIFAGAYELDARKRLVVARARIGGPRSN